MSDFAFNVGDAVTFKPMGKNPRTLKGTVIGFKDSARGTWVEVDAGVDGVYVTRPGLVA